MNDYMIALMERFGIETPELSACLAQARATEDKLRATLDGEQRKLLLCLTDRHNALREEAALSGFLSGWRLAEGIRNELDALPRYSVVEEDEARARELFEAERGTQNE